MSPGLDIWASADGAELAALVREEVQRDPVAIVRIASEIGRGRGNDPPAAVTRACLEESELIAQAPPSAIKAELEVCLCERDVDTALEWLHQVGFVRDRKSVV